MKLTRDQKMVIRAIALSTVADTTGQRTRQRFLKKRQQENNQSIITNNREGEVVADSSITTTFQSNEDFQVHADSISMMQNVTAAQQDQFAYKWNMPKPQSHVTPDLKPHSTNSWRSWGASVSGLILEQQQPTTNYFKNPSEDGGRAFPPKDVYDVLVALRTKKDPTPFELLIIYLLTAPQVAPEGALFEEILKKKNELEKNPESDYWNDQTLTTIPNLGKLAIYVQNNIAFLGDANLKKKLRGQKIPDTPEFLNKKKAR